jgi:hypothetical protein
VPLALGFWLCGFLGLYLSSLLQNTILTNNYMKSTKAYKVESIQDRAILLGILYSYGAKFHLCLGEEDAYDLDKALKEHTGYSQLLVEPVHNGVSISGTNYGSAVLSWPSQATEILAELKEYFKGKKPVFVSNVGDYSATICDEGIKVGCQTISFAKFQEIVDGVDKFNKQ